jgi:hypothetical protein
MYLPEPVFELVLAYVTDGEPGHRARCRICSRSSRRPGNIIAPCKCTGSMRGAHRGCLKLWIRHNAKERESGRCTRCEAELVDVADDSIEARWFSMRVSRDETAGQLLWAATALVFVLIMALCEYTVLQTLLHDRGARNMRAVAHLACETTDELAVASRACLMAASVVEIAVVFSIVLAIRVLVLERYRPPRTPIPRAIINVRRV